jgi:hypothetical protein
MGQDLPCVMVDASIHTNAKTIRLASNVMGGCVDEAVGKIFRLLGYAKHHRPDGVIGRPGEPDNMVQLTVETVCEWRGRRGRAGRRQPGVLYAALIDVGWLDRLPDGSVVIHDWPLMNPAHFSRAIETEKRKQRRLRELARETQEKAAWDGPPDDPNRPNMSRFDAQMRDMSANFGASSEKKNNDSDTLNSMSGGCPADVRPSLIIKPSPDGETAGAVALPAVVANEANPEFFIPQPTNQPKALPSFDRAPPKRARSLESVVVPAPFGWLVGWENEKEKTDREVAATYLGDVLRDLRREGIAAFAMRIAETLRPIAVDGEVLRVSIDEGMLGDYLEFLRPCVDEVMVKRLDKSWAPPQWRATLAEQLEPSRMEVTAGHKRRPVVDVPMMERVWHEARSARGIMPAKFDAGLAQGILAEAQAQGHHRNGVLAFSVTHFVFDDGVKAPGKPFSTFARPKVYRDRLDVKLALRAGWFFEEKNEEQLTGMG